MTEINTKDFKEKIFDFENETSWKYKGEIPCIITFSADWCGACKTLTPLLEEIEKDYEDDLIIYHVDIDTEPELSKMFSIRSIPAILFIPMDTKPEMSIGVMSKDKIEKAIKDVLKSNPYKYTKKSY